ncbi:MAG: hypothetical protein IH812_05635 [Proteobacteria bacterium]|nr:hypothetical protein [Pseudomonadota bacterium]MCH8308013.1 hypothetical protein [Pseudomonadota bacterium]
MSNLERTESLPDSRHRKTRRELSWRTVFYGFLRSRRRSTRRGDEGEPTYTDWHHPWLFFLATGTMLLSCMDAFFTLQLLDRGAVEVNPVMALVLSKSTLTFAATKLLLTGLGILMLVFLSRLRMFNLMRTGIILTIFFSFYACLVCYEFVYLLHMF